ncbi:MAG TPA: chloride channel protein [Chloroflexota bacterium]|jgi:H+/Cl- antiporter ClcA
MATESSSEVGVDVDQLVWGVVLGAAGAVGAFVFVAVTSYGTKLVYPVTPGPEPFSGSWHIAAIMTVAGLIVGLIHHFMPAKAEDVFAAVPAGRLDPRPVSSGVLVAAVSMIGGFAVGPEVPTGMVSAGLATWIAERCNTPAELRRTNVMAAVTGTFSGLFTAPLAGAMMGLELAHAQSRAYFRTLLIAFLAAIAGFAVFYGAQGDKFSPLLPFLNVAPYTLELWHLGVGILLGFVGTALALVFGLILWLMKRLMAPLDHQPIVRCTLAGLLLGLLGMALPLTLFLGTDGVVVVTRDAAVLGLALLIAVVFAKMVALAGALSAGFIGGPIVPWLFIGATAGVAVNLMFPQIPLAVAVTCLMTAVPAALAPIPLSVGVIVFLIAGLPVTQAIPMFIAGLVAFVVFQPLAAWVAGKRAQPEPGAPSVTAPRHEPELRQR